MTALPIRRELTASDTSPLLALARAIVDRDWPLALSLDKRFGSYDGAGLCSEDEWVREAQAALDGNPDDFEALLDRNAAYLDWQLEKPRWGAEYGRGEPMDFADWLPIYEARQCRKAAA